MSAIETTRPRPHREDIGAVLGGATFVAYAVNAIGDMTGFGFVGAGYLMSGLIGAALGLGRGVEARFLPFYASLQFKLGDFVAIAALRLPQTVSSRRS